MQKAGIRIKLLEDLEFVWPELEWIISAYNTISKGRSGKGVQISVRDIAAYLQICTVPDPEFFLTAILTLEQELLAYQNRIREAQDGSRD